MSLPQKEITINPADLSLGGILIEPETALADKTILRFSGYAEAADTRARKSFGQWFRQLTATVRLLSQNVPAGQTVHIAYTSGMSFFNKLVPTILIARFFGKKLVLHFLSNKAESELEEYGRRLRPFFRLCHRIEVTCDYTAGVFRAYGIPVSVVPLRVDRELFAPRLVKSVQPRIVITRHHTRGNNLIGAIKAFALVKQKYPRAELIMIGDGPRREWLEEVVRSERIHGVTFTGYLSHDNVAKQFAQADIYLNCAAIDGLPLSLLEALSAGLPVISTNVGDIPSVVEHGTSGLLVAVNDPPVIADRIIELVENPALVEKLSRKAVQAVSQYFKKQPGETASHNK